jgi:phosphocarrier protein
LITKTLKIINRQGMHARPAALLVSVADQFESEVTIEKDGIEVNGKSIMGVMTLAAACGSELTVKIDGPDEEEALEALEEIFRAKFNED